MSNIVAASTGVEIEQDQVKFRQQACLKNPNDFWQNTRSEESNTKTWSLSHWPDADKVLRYPGSMVQHDGWAPPALVLAIDALPANVKSGAHGVRSCGCVF